MQTIRIEAATDGKFLVDVVCDCGGNGLMDKATVEESFRHVIKLNTGEIKVLICNACQSEYAIRAQESHIHVLNKIPPVDSRVLFYEGTRYFLSNFSAFKVVWRDVEWMTSEHAYQAAKFDDEEIVAHIRNATSAHEAKKIGRAHPGKERQDWNEVKVATMEEILRAKLAQHPYIQRKLRESGEWHIFENSPRDSFWGRGPDWKGENHLGKLWMKLRAEMV